jgi:hypothetical protein
MKNHEQMLRAWGGPDFTLSPRSWALGVAIWSFQERINWVHLFIYLLTYFLQCWRSNSGFVFFLYSVSLSYLSFLFNISWLLFSQVFVSYCHERRKWCPWEEGLWKILMMVMTNMLGVRYFTNLWVMAIVLSLLSMT